MERVRIGRRGVQVPVAAIIAAIPAAIARAQAVGADDRDPDSPGGVQVTPGEVAEDVGAFFLALGEQVLPDVLAANGVG